MTKKTFISHRYKDKEKVHNIDNFTQSNGQKIPGKLIRVAQEKTQINAAEIDKKIKDAMSDCESVIFAIGNDNHNSPWIKREVELAVSKNIPKVVVQLPKTTGGLPPELKKSKSVEAKWNPTDIANILSKKTTYKK